MASNIVFRHLTVEEPKQDKIGIKVDPRGHTPYNRVRPSRRLEIVQTGVVGAKF